MKKLFWTLMVMSLATWPAFAEQAKAAKPKPLSAAQEAKRVEMRKIIEAKKAELNGSEWEVVMTPSDGKSNPEKDAFTFQNGQVKSKILSSRGFNTTNYTITAPEGSEMAIWETMQTSTNPKEGVVFIRGEWNKDQMRGVISQQMEEGKTRDYSFKTEKKSPIAPTTEEEKDQKKPDGSKGVAKDESAETPLAAEEGELVQQKAPKATQQTPAPKPKKKWWF